MYSKAEIYFSALHLSRTCKHNPCRRLGLHGNALGRSAKRGNECAGTNPSAPVKRKKQKKRNGRDTSVNLDCLCLPCLITHTKKGLSGVWLDKKCSPLRERLVNFLRGLSSRQKLLSHRHLILSLSFNGCYIEWVLSFEWVSECLSEFWSQLQFKEHKGYCVLAPWRSDETRYQYHFHNRKQKKRLWPAPYAPYTKGNWTFCLSFVTAYRRDRYFLLLFTGAIFFQPDSRKLPFP